MTTLRSRRLSASPEAGPGAGPGAGPPRRPGLLARIGSALAVVAVSILVPLVILEVGLRLFAPQPTAVNVSEWHPVYGWRNKPGARGFFRTKEFRMEARINSFGMRDDETTREKPPGTFRLLGLGDSFGFGHGVAVDSCFVSVAERALDERSRTLGGPRVEFLNAGVGKWGTAAEYLYLTREGFDFSPDVVVLSFCVDNDFENNADGNVLQLVDGRLVPVDNPEPTVRKMQRLTQGIPFYGFLAENSHLVNFLRLRASAIDYRRIGRKAHASVTDTTAGEPAPDRAWSERRMPVTLMLMDSLAAHTRAAGVGFLVLVIPSRYQTLPESRWNGPMFQDPRPHAAMVDTLIAHLDSLGVPVIYPLRELTEASRSGDQYFEERHLNDEGSRMVGELLFRGLVAAGLTPDVRSTGAAAAPEGTPRP